MADVRSFEDGDNVDQSIHLRCMQAGYHMLAARNREVHRDSVRRRRATNEIQGCELRNLQTERTATGVPDEMMYEESSILW